ncbi:MAG: acyltransferase [Planctomycetes bacterium]|nr:acyltransferase [Planctomycetota bacterium]
MFAWCPVYKIAVGGYWYYNYVEERRYHPKRFCRYGTDVTIGPGAFIRSPDRMSIGDGVFIGSNCYIDALGGLSLGNGCALASNTTILTLDHHHRGAESIPWGETRILKPVVLEDYVWIGMNASILPGVTVGEGAIVGLGSVVPKDVPSRAIVVGNPARIVGHRPQEDYEFLKKSGAVRPASRRCTRFWIPPEMRLKYAKLLENVGYSASAEHLEFRRED